MIRRLAVALSITAVSLPAAVADEGRRMLPGAIPTCVATSSTCVINQSGKYILTQDINPAVGFNTVEITANNVDLDLNGYRLSGSVFASAITADQVDNLAIRNGFIVLPPASNSFDFGIFIRRANGVVIEDLVISEGHSHVRFEGVRGFSVRRVTSRNAFNSGIGVADFGAGPSGTGTIEDCIVERSEIGIATLNSTSITIANNRIGGMTFGGILTGPVDGCIVKGNTVADSFEGILISSTTGCTVEGNTVTNSLNQGVTVSGDDNHVVGNVIRGSGVVGLFVLSNRNLIEGNLLNGNGNYGLQIEGDDNVYRRNTARGNGGTAACSATNSPPDFCDNGSMNSSPNDNFMPGLL